MANYLMQLKVCSDHLNEAGSEITDKELAFSMLAGLPESYDALTMSLSNLPDLKFTSARVKQVLITEYERRTERESAEAKVAYNVYKKKERKNQKLRFSGNCYKYGIARHMAKHCKTKLPEPSQY